jgi:hypothetical protein
VKGSVSNTSFLCPAGHACPAGSAYPVGCADSTYQPSVGQASCLPCTAGFYCNSNATAQLQCPARYYCPTLTGVPPLCPNGTYSSVPGLSSSAQCTACPAGSYCVGGQIAGVCSAGYLCLSGNLSPTPATASFGGASAGGVQGGPCPAGHYCLAGDSAARACPDQTNNPSPFGASLSACVSCTPGYRCPSGDPLQYPCPAGYYCPPGAGAGYQALPCPAGTWSAVTGAANSSVCQACPAGYFCSLTGTVDYTAFGCPPGQFCSLGTAPTPSPCPAGRYRPSTGAAAVSGCDPCRAGYYCASYVCHSILCCCFGCVSPVLTRCAVL